MKRWPRRYALPLLCAILLIAALAMSATSAGAERGAAASEPEVVPGRYIVTFADGVEPSGKLAAMRDVATRQLYRGAMNGFAADLSDEQLSRLRSDPDVRAIVPDIVMRASADTIPTGVRRSWADRNATSEVGTGTNPIAVDVAVVDTGVDGAHPDLLVAGGYNCVVGEPTTDWADGNGHGTHVAGTIGARDNGSGVVGVAPGTRIWAVRVLNDAGEGTMSDVICGINWIIANSATIDVVNLSLGGLAPEGTCADGGLHEAICDLVALDIPVIVAAGNDAANAALYAPASYDEVITVSAITDTDGFPYAKGASSFLYGADDTLAAYSNFGADVDIAAPGTNIRSTWPGNQYMTISGTSMASPHVAGAAAVWKYLHPTDDVAQVRAALLAAAWAQNAPEGFAGDTDGNAEPLLNAGAVGGAPLPLPEPLCTFDPTSVRPGDKVTINCARFQANENVRVYWDSDATTYRTTMRTKADGTTTGAFTVPDSVYGPHTIILVGQTGGQRLEHACDVEPKVKLYTNTGKVDGLVSVKVLGFGANETVNLEWVNGASATFLKSGVTSAVGTASIYVKVPEAAYGSYTLRATGDTSGAEGTNTFTVTSSAAAQPNTAKVGATSEFRVRGFRPNETVTVTWVDKPGVTRLIHTGTTSALGSLTFSLTVPESTFGEHAIRVVGDQGSSANGSLRVTTSMTMTPTQGPAGTSVAITFTGYGASETVNINWYTGLTLTSVVTTTTSSALGSGSVTFSAPLAVAGAHKVEAQGMTSGAKGSSYFSTRGTIALDDADGPAGTLVTISLTGYRAGESVSVRWYKTSWSYDVIATGTALADGTATISFTVPANATLGSHKVEALGSASFQRASTTFTVQ